MLLNNKSMVATVTTPPPAGIVSWAPDGQHIALVDGSEVSVYSWDGTNLSNPVTMAIAIILMFPGALMGKRLLWGQALGISYYSRGMGKHYLK